MREGSLDKMGESDVMCLTAANHTFCLHARGEQFLVDSTLDVRGQKETCYLTGRLGFCLLFLVIYGVTHLFPTISGKNPLQ